MYELLLELFTGEIKEEHSMRIVVTKATKHNNCRMFSLHILLIHLLPL